jgi:hypothetical protein
MVSHQDGKWNSERTDFFRESNFGFGTKVTFSQRRFPPENSGSLEMSVFSHFSALTIN